MKEDKTYYPMYKKMKILVVAGHPADMFDHCGGTLLHHVRRGDEVTCVSITQGLRIHDEVVSDLFRHHIGEYTEEQIAEIVKERQKVKYQEAIDACALFGVHDVRFLDYDDEILTVNGPMISKLASLLREVQPDLVITHWPYQGDTFSNHHAVTGQLTLAAVTAAAGVNFADRNPACKVAQIAFMLCPLDVTCRNVTGLGKTAYISYYVDVTDVIEQKVRAVNMMRSQKYDLPGSAHKTTEIWSGNFGNAIRIPYAEGFAFEYPEIGECIPVSKTRRWLQTEDEEKLLRNAAGLQAMDVKLVERD